MVLLDTHLLADNGVEGPWPISEAELQKNIQNQ